MSNIGIYFDNVLRGGSQVTASGLNDAAYLFDGKLGYMTTSQGSHAYLEVLQDPLNTRAWRYAHFLGMEDLSGGTLIVLASSDISRVDQFVAFSGSIFPGQIDISPDTFDQNYGILDIHIQGPNDGVPWSCRELLISTLYTPPMRPAVGIRNGYEANSTTIDLPNGERQRIDHAGVSRVKTYRIEGLDMFQADTLSRIFTTTLGTDLVVLEDDRGQQYPALVEADAFLVNDESLIFDLELTFREVNI